jgi:hypothetical protein
MLRKLFATGIALACFVGANSQDSAALVEEKPKPTFTGYVDVYYRYNFANARNVGDEGVTNNFTSFTNSQNSFELGMASLKVEHSFGKVGVVADLGFGTRAEEFSYNDANTMLAIKQAYLTYAPNDKLKFTAGSWATHVGYELVDPYLNRNYSMSYMFSYGPFFHTGVKAELTAGKSTFMLGIANPTDLKRANFAQKMLLAQYAVAANDRLKFYLNYQGGKADEMKKLNQFDLVVLGTLSDKFNIGYNGTVQSVKLKDELTNKFEDANSWWGSALYLNYDPTSKFGLTLRGEYFDDKKEVIGFNSSIIATTLSGNIRIGGLTIIPEFRLENADTELYVKSKGEGSKSTASFLMAAIYKFP